MEEDDSVTRSYVILDGPLDSVGRFIGKVNGNADLAAGAGGGGGRRVGGWMVRRRRVVDLDCWKLRVVTVI